VTSVRKQAHRRPAAGKTASAPADKGQMLGTAVLVDKEKTQGDRAVDGRISAPRAGRTGGLGTRAERPSEGGTRRSTGNQPLEPGRSSKAPSARDDAGQSQDRRATR
jgi:hypothetical protein